MGRAARFLSLNIISIFLNVKKNMHYLFSSKTAYFGEKFTDYLGIIGYLLIQLSKINLKMLIILSKIMYI